MGTEDKVIRCKAAVAWEPGKPLCIEEVEVAPPKAHEVRIKVAASGVCHTDWSYLYECGKGMKPRPFPLVLGHEGAGVVESVGPEVRGFSPGDKVIPLFLPQCGECECCLSPKTNLCSKNWENTQQGVLADGTSRITCRGQQVYQFIGVSTFSEFTVVPEHNITKIHPDAPLDRVCLLGCGVATGYGAVLNTGKCGVTEFINPKDHSKPIQEVLSEMTGGGVDYCFECVGNVAVMRAALESCKPAWGTCVIVGWTELEEMSLSPIDILLGRTLKGTYFGGWKSVEGVPRLVEDYMSGRLRLDEFVTHTLSLEQINEAFDLLVSGKSIRTVITM